MRLSKAEILREYGPFPGVDHVDGVTFDGQHIWFASGDKLNVLDPASGKTVRSIDVAADAGTAFDGQHLFQLAEDLIQKIDPKTGRVLATIPAPGGGDSGLAWAEGTLWVGQYRDRKIHQIDPQTGATLRTIESNRFVTGVTWIDGELWHGTWEGEESDLRRVDPRTGEVLERLEMPPGTGVSGLEADGGDQFFCGGGRSGKVRAVRWPRRVPRAGSGSKAPVDLTSNIVVREVIRRPPQDRPAHETVDGIAEWLVGAARHNASGAESFDQFAWRLLAAGLPLLRVTLHVGTIHPQFLGTTMVWWRDLGHTTQVLIGHEIGDAIPYEKNPVRRVCEGRETLRRRLDLPDDQLDFDVLFELRERGGTDYLALPVAGAHAVAYMVTFVTGRPDGFTTAEIDDLSRVAQRLAVVIDRYSQEWVTHNVLTAYLGVRTGPKVLAGQIRRGHGVELTAVLWSSDLRGFTERSDLLPPDRMIEILNALFDAQALAIREHGGEILKFIGDGILAMFPIEERATLPAAAHSALAAAHAALAAVQRLADNPVMAGEPSLEIVVALHVGTVTYGNIGATDRLDFTVIGPAVNLVSRIEGVAKALDRPILVSSDFARALGDGVVSLGLHDLRGLATPQELFAPA